MRVVLRVEVEAVKFLKEEPHRLEALLQRCNNIRDTLGTLRRSARLRTAATYRPHSSFHPFLQPSLLPFLPRPST